MQFLRCRWPSEVLVEMHWDYIEATVMGDCVIEAMFAGERAVLFKLGQHQRGLGGNMTGSSDKSTA